jgi:hypothetical protein
MSVETVFIRQDMINIHSCHQTINIVAGDKVTCHLKELSQILLTGTERRNFQICLGDSSVVFSTPAVLPYSSEVPDL